MQRCPGQDMRYWTPEDIFDVNCPYCDYPIEFWRDEPFRLCRSCRKEVRNPRIDLGCAKWCKFGDQCLGRSATEQLAAAPVIEKLTALLDPLSETDPDQYVLAMEIARISNLLLTSEGGDPCRIKTAALLAGAVQERDNPDQMVRSMLAQTILSPEETDVIAGLIRQILSDEPSESLEVTVVRDALILARTTLQDESDLQKLGTEGAKMIFRLRLKKKRVAN